MTEPALDVAASRWSQTLGLLGSQRVLGPGEIAVLRLAQVIDVDTVDTHTIVLIVSFSLPRDILERNRAAVTEAMTKAWGQPVVFEVTIAPTDVMPDYSSSAPVTPAAPVSAGLTQSVAAPTVVPGESGGPGDGGSGGGGPAAGGPAAAGSVGNGMRATASVPGAPSGMPRAGSGAPTPVAPATVPGSSLPDDAAAAAGIAGAPTGPAATEAAPGLSTASTPVPPSAPVSGPGAMPDTFSPISSTPTTQPSAGNVSSAGTYGSASGSTSMTGASQPSVPGATTHVPAPTVPAPSASVGATNPNASKLNPRYTFSSYVQAQSNRLALAAAIAVAEAPSKAYNPLFIYGDSGLGKTHLLHAIGHYARELHSGIVVKYVNSEEFLSDFIASTAANQMPAFKERYRNVDLLLLDDVQFFEGKEQTMEEFFHTFNALRTAEKQIVLTSDQPVLELKGFNNRLISRFQEGLVADIQPPDLETRQAILTLKARADQISVSDEVLEYIASRVTTNIRELEGALVRVTAFASLNKQSISLPLAEMALKDVITDPSGEEITTGLIMSTVADYFSITVDELCGESRRKNVVHPRHIAMYLCRELTVNSLPAIGREFGGRDHTTVLSAWRKISDQMGEQRETFNEVNEITSRIKQATLKPRG